MAIRPLNSIAGFSAGDPAITVIQANGDVTTVNLTANGLSNLGQVANLTILGGNVGEYLQTDGAGNLTWDSIGNLSSNRAAPMPYLIPNGESYIVNENFQGLYSQAITIDGELTVDGILIEVPISFAADPNQILFAENGTPTGRENFSIEPISGDVRLPGNVDVKGDILPNLNVTYNLGSSTRRWNDLWLSNSTIYIGNSSITTDANTLVFTSGSGATLEVAGDANVSTLLNGNSNISIDTNGPITFGVTGVPNVLVITSNGVEFTGTIDFAGNVDVTGNISPGGIKTDNYYYANGAPVDFQQAAGSNSQIQFNNNNDFGASANLTFNTATNLLSVAGNLSVSGVTSVTDLAVSGNAVVSGNLQVNGNLIYINVEEFSVEDPIVNLNTGPNGSPPASNTGKDIGTALNYYDTQARIAFMGWDTSAAEFAFGSQVTLNNEIVTFNTLGNVRAQTFKGNVEATTIAGNLTTATQSNITTVGTLGNLSVTSNITSGNITSGNVNAGNLLTANYLISNSGCVMIGSGAIALSGATGGIFNASVDDINLGLAANITLGSTTGNTTVRGNLVANNNITVSGNISANLITGTLTTASQSNITTVGTLGNLSVTNSITSNTVTSNSATLNQVIGKRSNISVTTGTVIDSFAANTYRTAKYTVRSSNDLGYESLEVLLIHNNINSYITVYGAINTGGGNTVNITTALDSGTVELRATGLSSNTVVNLIATYVSD